MKVCSSIITYSVLSPSLSLTLFIYLSPSPYLSLFYMCASIQTTCRLSHEIFSLEPLAICVFNINTLGIYYNGSDNLVYGLVSGRCIAILLCLLWSFALLAEQVLSSLGLFFHLVFFGNCKLLSWMVRNLIVVYWLL